MVRLSPLLTLRRTGPLATWRPNLKAKTADSWRRNLALIYALSAWTIFGATGYWYFKKKDDISAEESAQDAEMLQDAAELDPSVQKKKPSYTYKIVYKENFVPYTTRIYQYFTSSDNKSDDSSIDK